MGDMTPEIVLDSHCISQHHPWSIPDISGPNATLAGVLAGFMILAMTTLLTIDSKDPYFRPSVKHATLLLGLGVIVLGLDAYFFGSIAATKPIDTPGGSADLASQACQRAWVEFMPAAGLLVVGAVVLVAGLSWAIFSRYGDLPERYKLAQRTNYAILFVSVGSYLFLMIDALIFIDEMREEFDSITHFGQLGARCVVVFVTVAFCGAVAPWVLVENNKLKIRYKELERPKQVSADACSADLTAKEDKDQCTKGPRNRPSEADEPTAIGRNVTFAAKGICAYLGLAIIFTLIAGWASGTHCGFMADCVFGFGLGIFMCIGGPGIAFALMVHASPGMNQDPDGAQRVREPATGTQT